MTGYLKITKIPLITLHITGKRDLNQLYLYGLSYNKYPVRNSLFICQRQVSNDKRLKYLKSAFVGGQL